MEDLEIEPKNFDINKYLDSFKETLNYSKIHQPYSKFNEILEDLIAKLESVNQKMKFD